MRFEAQLLSLSKGKEQAATVKFSCTLQNFIELSKMVGDFRIKFQIDGSEDVLLGEIKGIYAANGNYIFKLQFPGTENVKTSQLSMLCEKLLNINIDLDV